MSALLFRVEYVVQRGNSLNHPNEIWEDVGKPGETFNDARARRDTLWTRPEAVGMNWRIMQRIIFEQEATG